MMLVLVICYNRFENLTYWYEAWQHMDTTDCKLVFGITGHFVDNAFDPKIAEVIRLPNVGRDLGALKSFVNSREDYDRLLWCPDDFLPMRADLLKHYTTADVVGTFWSHGGGYYGSPDGTFQFWDIPPHIRTGGVSVLKHAAKGLVLPPELDLSPESGVLYRKFAVQFEFFDFYKQLVDMGCSVKMADGTTPPNSPHWCNTPQHYLCDVENATLSGVDTRHMLGWWKR